MPVAKGNGYGFGIGRLAAAEAARGSASTPSPSGTYHEVAGSRRASTASVLVLTPVATVRDPRDARPRTVVHTVGRLEDLRRAAGRAATGAPRVVLERLTSMRRHGFTAARPAGGRPGCAGDRHRSRGSRCTCRLATGSHLTEVQRLMTDVVAAGLPTRTRLRLAT